MFVTMMKAKLHRATVTQADLDYEGSIAIDRDLLDASGILPHEQVDVLNITTGARFTTYAIEAPRGSRTIGVNGAAARLVQAGDKVIVVTYCQMDASYSRSACVTVARCSFAFIIVTSMGTWSNPVMLQARAYRALRPWVQLHRSNRLTQSCGNPWPPSVVTLTALHRRPPWPSTSTPLPANPSPSRG